MAGWRRPFEADAVEYGEWTSGVRTEGAAYAVFSFTRKLGQSLGGCGRLRARRRAATCETTARRNAAAREPQLTRVPVDA